MNIAIDRDAVRMAHVVEIRARGDRNRLLGTYDPVRRVLRLFHRGQTVTVPMAELDGQPQAELGANGNHLT